MRETTLTIAFIWLALTCAAASPAKAQESAAQQRAVALLEQVVDEAQLLKLPDNRIRVQTTAASVLWAHNEARARSLFALAAEGVAEMMRSPDMDARTAAQLRRTLLLTVARHDATLAYRLLPATRPIANPADARMSREADSEDQLKQTLAARVATLDPTLALHQAEQLLDAGHYESLDETLVQLQRKDADGAARLQARMLERLQSENFLTNAAAGNLALSFLQRKPVANQGPSAYRDLLGLVVEAALKATPGSASREDATVSGARGNKAHGRRLNASSAGSDAQLEQNNARRLLRGLQPLLPRIDQYLPGRAQLVRQKIGDGASVENQSGGRSDDPAVTPLVAGAVTLEAIRQSVWQLRTDAERVERLIDWAALVRENNPTLAMQALDDARQLTTPRATSYHQFDAQLKVADAFAEVDPSRGFEVLEPGILQLNELLSAAAALSGFEVDIFTHGELPIEGDSNLCSLIAQYGQRLGRLARNDFERAKALANAFQRAEPRIVAMLAIVADALGAPAVVD
jgi:hypothetical protein